MTIKLIINDNFYIFKIETVKSSIIIRNTIPVGMKYGI